VLYFSLTNYNKSKQLVDTIVLQKPKKVKKWKHFEN